MGVHKFSENLGTDLKITHARRVTRGTEDLQILGATIQNLVTRVTLRPGFFHPCFRISKTILHLL
jgi:hypothetical protein